MSLMLVATEAGLTAKIRNRMAQGVAVSEIDTADMPAWLAEAVSGAAVQTAFVSAHAGVAVLANGSTVARKAPR